MFPVPLFVHLTDFIKSGIKYHLNGPTSVTFTIVLQSKPYIKPPL